MEKRALGAAWRGAARGARAGLLLVAAWSLTGCLRDPTGPVACTREARPGVVVEVVGADTGLPLAEGSALTLQDGDYVETSTQVRDGKFLLGAFERAGTYDVRVDREGFVSWRDVAVQVDRDDCHVLSVQLFAIMVDLREPR